jgi:hypothetical protein
LFGLSMVWNGGRYFLTRLEMIGSEEVSRSLFKITPDENL